MSEFIAILVGLPGVLLSLFFMVICAWVGGGILHWLFGGPYWLWAIVFGIIGLAYKPPINKRT